MTCFPPLPFERMNEADVREEVIAPLIRELGYRTGTDFDVIREQGLRYPRQYLGRKNASRDPELRGKADYILEVSRRVRWVIEAKAPSAELGSNDFEQAWSYANHPEVRAVYFVVCNGLRTLVFSTSFGPNVPAILDIGYSDFSTGLSEITNILGPASIERDFPDLSMQLSPPLGPGLRSIARIASGVIRYLQSSVNNPALRQLQTFVMDGSLERDEAGCLTAYLKTHAPVREIQEFNESLGFDGFELKSADTVLSVDPLRPTVFTYQASLTFPQGTPLLDITSWKRVVLPIALHCHIEATASGALIGTEFSGIFSSVLSYESVLTERILLDGDFKLRVS